MKSTLVTLISLAVLCCSCSSDEEAGDYCRSLLSGMPTSRVSVHDLYVYGTLHHGSVAVSADCPGSPFVFSSLQTSPVGEDEGGARVSAFNAVVFNTPVTKSGMFRLDGVVDVLPDQKLIRLVDVSNFREVEEVESRKVLDSLSRRP
ncbi:hypothetical protein [uncultured Pseudoxanthomonas sp.]|uniref:hypothetical protein n=1 Tax=uncultured Pseudoxanthomonas sp. TaxID=281701 RepID=UPI002601E0ED|nr:hypothetical protein [uncultured Pseudoxanthomonas sp.]